MESAKKKYGEVVTNKHVTQELGALWKALDPEKKKKYEDMATKDKARYQEEKSKYLGK